MADEKDLHDEYVGEKEDVKKKRNIFLTKNQTKEQKKKETIHQEVAAGDTPPVLPSDAGVFHTNVREKRIFYKKAPNEYVVNNAGAYIVLGTDRTGTLAEGNGALGAQKASSIDLVVGRMSSVKKGEGLKDGAHVGPSFSGDAARVYISQLTQLDKAFGLAAGVSGHLGSAAGIGIKADDVRIVGRRSIKIVTGRQKGVTGNGKGGEPTALGDWMHQRAPTIELIAGNHTESRYVFGGLKNPVEKINTLQRACLGSNTTDGLKELVALVGQLWSATYNLALIQTSWNGVLSVDPFRPWVAAAGPQVATGNIGKVLASLYRTKISCLQWEQNYTEPYGYKYICSTNVKIC
tara:strand:+ start:1130 stop:2176 length:1047 start_codon:yes stop_codon:yes gene_type:complete